ncbi:GH36-type glycosyl hydrolase domain-containing protein [Dokdonella sp.]|uniref:GH36-type glycosyl hydrolase domain-containing protein n=1 Tax=Dokdonella sp. TaxID=2291710 RepID=UPI0031BCFE9F|nr:glycosyl transferase family 36 [Dokdonella sp.]
MLSKAAHTTPAARHATLLSNGRYSTLVTSRGGGFSTWQNLAITRWRADPTCDPWGPQVLLRELDGGTVWSMGPGPLGCVDAEDVTLSGSFARFRRQVAGLVTTLEIAICADHDAEMRRITLHNPGSQPRTVEVTSWLELVLGPGKADASHPAFSKMFVQTEWDPAGLLLATRRPSAADEPRIHAGHWCSAGPNPTDADPGAPQFETDRARFLGRCRTLGQAVAMQGEARLSGTVGTVLDPIFSVRQRVRIASGARVQLAFWTAAAASREGVMDAFAALQTSAALARSLAAPDAAVSPEDAACERHRDLLAPLLYADPARRPPAHVLVRGRGGPPTLWAGGISGDRPILLQCIGDAADVAAVPDLLDAQRGWQARRLGIDVVCLVRAPADAAEGLMNRLQPLVDAQKDALAARHDTRAEAFVLCSERISAELRDGLLTAAQVVLGCREDDGEVADAAEAAGPAAAREEGLAPARPAALVAAEALFPAAQGDWKELAFPNGLGGFAADARAYRIALAQGRCTPMPWINVMANRDFGFFVSAEGGGYSWSVNSQQNPLTPWPNDPVQDAPHDVLYLRDQDSGQLWSACASPIRVAGARYEVCHGKGYSRFRTEAHGIDSELLQFVPCDDPVKISCLRLRNTGEGARRLCVTAYVDWALAPNGVDGGPHVVTSLDEASGALFARNAWRAPFTDHVAFLDLAGMQQAATADRGEFIGAQGDIGHPAALADGAALSGRVGAGLDPCGALQVHFELAPGATLDLLCVLGEGTSTEAARALVVKYRKAELGAVFEQMCSAWRQLLDTVQVRTPDRAMDLMLNDWLPYQVLSCRVWARTAYYQASGAFGFRDQLQDVLALCLSRPDVVRAHLLRAASRQFVEGDVQHWWLPPEGRGIRTRMSDDRLWLVWAALHYVAVTGERAVLDEEVAFLEGPALEEGQLDAFFAPKVSTQSGSVYEHCARAVDASLGLGPHDLPLIGTGDWNDGMNRVGVDGRGESVWLAWFLLANIDGLSQWAQQRGDTDRLARWRACRERVVAALGASAWDGSWFRRGYYDDGTPLGSAASEECRIDQIAQSWSVLSGVADPVRARQAMRAVSDLLVWRDARISPLLTPPFDFTGHNPGYIKGYPPGLRENGGQYTHGATWSIFAYAALGEGGRAAELFSFLNPVTHADSEAALARYQAEPYAACGDVYSVAPHIGRAGWSWYTGSAGWLYRAGVEAILGFRVQGDELEIDPAMPAGWPGFEIAWQRRDGTGRVTPYTIVVENPAHVSCGVARAMLDGKSIDPRPQARRGVRVPLQHDGQPHQVRVELG